MKNGECAARMGLRLAPSVSEGIGRSVPSLTLRGRHGYHGSEIRNSMRPIDNRPAV